MAPRVKRRYRVDGGPTRCGGQTSVGVPARGFAGFFFATDAAFPAPGRRATAFLAPGVRALRFPGRRLAAPAAGRRHLDTNQIRSPAPAAIPNQTGGTPQPPDTQYPAS